MKYRLQIEDTDFKFTFLEKLDENMHIKLTDVKYYQKNDINLKNIFMFIKTSKKEIKNKQNNVLRIKKATQMTLENLYGKIKQTMVTDSRMHNDNKAQSSANRLKHDESKVSGENMKNQSRIDFDLSHSQFDSNQEGKKQSMNLKSVISKFPFSVYKLFVFRQK